MTYVVSQIGVEFALKVINWDAKTEIRLQLWDIAGEVNSIVPVVFSFLRFSSPLRPRTVWKYDEGNARNARGHVVVVSLQR